MLRVTVRIALVLILCSVIGQVEARPAPRTINVAAHVSGLLSFQLAGDVVDITVIGAGRAGALGAMSAEASWSPDAMALMDLFLGEIDELHIGSGVFHATFANGTVSGALSGTIRARRDGRFSLDAEFTVTQATGALVGATGTGRLRAVQDVQTLESNASLQVKLTLP